MLVQFLQMRGIGAEGIFGDNEGPIWVVLPQLAKKTFGCIPFTIIFRLAILFDDGFGGQQEHFFEMMNLKSLPALLPKRKLLPFSEISDNDNGGSEND